MAEDRVLEKTNRMNLLLAFYEPLLTDRQRTFLKQYFHEDFTLGEIAEVFDISRQAVFEHIKRAESTLEEYEHKLGLLAKHDARRTVVREMERLLSGAEPPERESLRRLLRQLDEVDGE